LIENFFHHFYLPSFTIFLSRLKPSQGGSPSWYLWYEAGIKKL